MKISVFIIVLISNLVIESIQDFDDDMMIVRFLKFI
jgi:hypothetical protein